MLTMFGDYFSESFLNMILIAIGTRPQIIKFAPFYWELVQSMHVINTGQHFDYENVNHFNDFKIPLPDYNLEVMVVVKPADWSFFATIDPIFNRIKPSICVVFGDMIQLLLLASNKLGIPLAHIEAGLRSFNLNMPEETNRILVDRIANWNFCPIKLAYQNLAS